MCRLVMQAERGCHRRTERDTRYERHQSVLMVFMEFDLEGNFFYLPQTSILRSLKSCMHRKVLGRNNYTVLITKLSLQHANRSDRTSLLPHVRARRCVCHVKT